MASNLVMLEFETFQFGTPLHHPVNLAYEAATDLDDVNMIDPFPPPKPMAKRSPSTGILKSSPCLEADVGTHLGSLLTLLADIGVNMVGFAIVDSDAAIEASKQGSTSRLL